MIYLALWRSSDKAWISTSFSLMITSLSLEIWEPKSVSSSSIKIKSLSWPSEGPSSCNGCFPLSYTCSAEEEGKAPFTPGEDNIFLLFGEENETPSTSGGDNTCLAAANSLIVPFSWVKNTGTPIGSVSWTSSWFEGPPSSWSTNGVTWGLLNTSCAMKVSQEIFNKLS